MQAKKELILTTQRVLSFPIKHVVTNESSARSFTLKVIYLFRRLFTCYFPYRRSRSRSPRRRRRRYVADLN